ncbi:MAG: transporter suffix domain-containing protein [Bacteroidales bacterium]
MDWKNKSRKFKAGIVFILISIVLFTFLTVVPFVPLDKEIRIIVGTTSFVLAEVLFYLGSFLVGKEYYSRYKYWLNPLNWFRKKPAVSEIQKIEDQN